MLKPYHGQNTGALEILMFFRPEFAQPVEELVSRDPHVFRKLCTTLMVVLSTVGLNIEGCLGLEKYLPREF